LQGTGPSLAKAIILAIASRPGRFSCTVAPQPLMATQIKKTRPFIAAASAGSISLPSPANDVGFNLTVGLDAVPCAVNPTARKRKHVGAIVIFTKQFHQFPGWRFAN
jgi:hypothetical protein